MDNSEKQSHFQEGQNAPLPPPRKILVYVCYCCGGVNSRVLVGGEVVGG